MLVERRDWMRTSKNWNGCLDIYSLQWQGNNKIISIEMKAVLTQQHQQTETIIGSTTTTTEEKLITIITKRATPTPTQDHTVIPNE